MPQREHQDTKTPKSRMMILKRHGYPYTLTLPLALAGWRLRKPSFSIIGKFNTHAGLKRRALEIPSAAGGIYSVNDAPCSSFSCLTTPLLARGNRKTFDPDFGSGLDAAAAIRARTISSVELTKHVFERIDRFELRLNAFVYQMREEALVSARRIDEAGKERRLPPFAGVPVVLKESFGVAGGGVPARPYRQRDADGIDAGRTASLYESAAVICECRDNNGLSGNRGAGGEDVKWASRWHPNRGTVS